MATHRVYFAKGAQTLTTIPHRAGSPVRVSAATYAILDTRYGVDSAEHVVVAAGTAGTVDSVSTTLNARAGRAASDRRALTLVSTTGVLAGHAYLLTSTTGAVELVSVSAVVSATVLRTVSEIRGDFATGSTFKGIEVSATFPADPAADDDNLDTDAFLLVWTIADFPPIRESIYLERGEESQLASLTDLSELDPMVPLAGGDRVSPAAALARAHKDFRTDLVMAGVSESDLLTGPIGRDAVTYRAAALVYQHNDDEVSARKYKDYGARYQQLLNGIIIGAKKPQVLALDKSEESAVAVNPATLFFGFGFQPGGR